MPTISCPSCRYANPPAQGYCSVCGTRLPASGAGTGSPTPAPPPSKTPVARLKALFFPDPVRVRGNVVTLNKYKIPAELRMGGNVAGPVLVWFVVFLVLLMILPALLKTLVPLALNLFFQLLLICGLVSALKFMADGALGKGGIGVNPVSMASRLVSMILRPLARAGSRRGRQDRDREITVHEVVVLDRANSKQVLVRIEGDFVEGGIGLNHEIEVEGQDRNGTLLFRDGVNHSLGLGRGGTRIRVARPDRWS